MRPHPGCSGVRTSELLDQALVALAGGDRRTILELVRDRPEPLGAMAGRFGMSHQAVSQDLSAFHDLEYEDQLDELAGRYDPHLLAAARLEPGSVVLDVGCGSGVSTRAAARIATAGRALGVDVSAAAIGRARERSRNEGVANASFERADAEVHPFAPGSFDSVISRFGAMYFAHPVPAFANLLRALRPGGRLALVAWRELAANPWMTAVRRPLARGRALPERAAGSPGAFGLADEAVARRVLTEAGFAAVAVEGFDEPVCFGPDADRAYALVSTQKLARDLLDGLDAAARRRALDDLRAVLEAHATPDGVLFGSACWVITAERPADGPGAPAA